MCWFFVPKGVLKPCLPYRCEVEVADPHGDTQTLSYHWWQLPVEGQQNPHTAHCWDLISQKNLGVRT